MPFILALIAFNLLDLDASDLAALTRCFDHFVVDADLTAPPGVDPLPENLDCLQTTRIIISQKPRDQAAAICASCVPYLISEKFALIFITLAYPETPFLGLALAIMEGPDQLARKFLRFNEPRGLSFLFTVQASQHVVQG